MWMHVHNHGRQLVNRAYNFLEDIQPGLAPKVFGGVATGAVVSYVAVRGYRYYCARRTVKERGEVARQACQTLRDHLNEERPVDKEKEAMIVSLEMAELQQKLLKGELKAVEVLRAYQRKALEVHDRLNCITEPIFEAEALAVELDLLQPHQRKPLHGIPVSIKDSIHLEGYDCHAGYSYFANKPAEKDADIVQTLKSLGAVPFVRTNFPQGLLTIACSNPMYGQTKNPHDLKRGPGGSSGGEGALLAGGGSIVAIGSDVGGSIRVPTQFCGVYGLKPTVERIGNRGHMTLSVGQNLDAVTFHPRLVNQEKGGLIIYTWTDISEDAKVVGPVSHVGVYDPATQKHKVLWIYNQKVKIVSCSLNRERTLLGFTTVTKQESGQDGKPKELYQAFLAELQSLDPRVFSLNLQRHSYLKVQFLYPDTTGSTSSTSGSSRHSHMIVMLHKESIGLYQIHMARIGDRGIMMSGQPTTDQIVRKFVWCQWDAPSQRLYYIHNVRQSNNNSESVGQKLSAIQFHSGNKFDNMIDVPINFPFPYMRTSTRSCYADTSLHQGIPDGFLNAMVLSQPNGSLCLCYQEYISSTARPSCTTSPLPKQEEETDPATVDVNYYVCMVHHAKTLHGCATGLPRSLVAGRRVTFQWFGDYLVVMMPGVFCHLLNVNLDYEPCHHILLHNHAIPTVTKPPVPSSRGVSQGVSKVSAFSSTSKSSNSNSTDTSDPAQDKSSITASSVLAVSGSQAGKATQPFYSSSSDPACTEGSSGGKTESDPVGSSSQAQQSLSPPPTPFVGLGYSICSPSPRISVSPRLRVGSGELPETISVTDGDCLKFGFLLAPCNGFSREAGMAGASLYDARSGQVWRLVSKPERLVQAFKAAYWSTQLAILHYLILMRTRDIFTIKQIFEVLTADPTAPELTTFLSEYLVASTFASMKKKADRETTQLMTFTTADTFRGQFEKSSSGERLARVSYLSLDSVNISTKVSQERRRRSSEDSWDLLRRNLRLKQMVPPSRFSHEHVLKALQKEIDGNGAPNKKWTWVSEELRESFFDGVHTVKLTAIPNMRRGGSTSSEGGGRRSRTETVLGSSPLFLQANQSIKSEPKKKVSSVTEQLVVSHLMHHLKKESRIKAQNIAREYITCQSQQCQQLCHLLWSIHTEEETTAYERLLPRLNEVGTDKEYQLFQVYERVFLVTQELAFPRPPGFPSYFTALGFKCLTSSLFLQYVDRGILQLTPDFILQLIEDLKDNEEGNTDTKFHIISRLPKPFAEDCFRRWHHPVTAHFAARQQVAQVLQEGFAMSRPRTDGDTGDSEDRRQERSRSYTSGDSQSITSTETASFKPLTIFIGHLEDTAMEVQRRRPGSSSLMYDTAAIEEAALFHTRTHSQYDLSAMNF